MKDKLLTIVQNEEKVFSAGAERERTRLKAVVERTVTELTLPENLTAIGRGAFTDCEALALTELPETVKTIGDYAFQNCKGLALTRLPEGLTCIGACAFENCDGMWLDTDYALPDGITTIGDSAFSGCGRVYVSKLPASLKTVGNYAFQGCSMYTLSFPAGLETVGDHIARDCDALYGVVFKGVPQSISPAAFSGCKNLSTIQVPWWPGDVAGEPWGAENASINYNGGDGLDMINISHNTGTFSTEKVAGANSLRSLYIDATAGTTRVKFTPKNKLDLAGGSLTAWFHFGESTPPKIYFLGLNADGTGSSMKTFTIGEPNADGWCKGTLDMTVFTETQQAVLKETAEFQIIVPKSYDVYVDELLHIPQY